MALSRRGLLKSGALAALVLAAGGGICRFAYRAAQPDRFVLDGEARAAIDAIVPAMLARALPQERAARGAAIPLATERVPVHELAERYTSWGAAKQGIAALPYKVRITQVVSAHVMGGCGMSPDERLGVVRQDGRYHRVRKLSVHDGSLFPTSIGANPQLSIYAIAARLASGLALTLA